MKFFVNNVIHLIILLVKPVKYKEDCELINKFINDIKDKGLSPD